MYKVKCMHNIQDVMDYVKICIGKHWNCDHILGEGCLGHFFLLHILQYFLAFL